MFIRILLYHIIPPCTAHFIKILFESFYFQQFIQYFAQNVSILTTFQIFPIHNSAATSLIRVVMSKIFFQKQYAKERYHCIITVGRLARTTISERTLYHHHV